MPEEKELRNQIPILKGYFVLISVGGRDYIVGIFNRTYQTKSGFTKATKKV